MLILYRTVYDLHQLLAAICMRYASRCVVPLFVVLDSGRMRSLHVPLTSNKGGDLRFVYGLPPAPAAGYMPVGSGGGKYLVDDVRPGAITHLTTFR
jgi:hypothetical protein